MAIAEPRSAWVFPGQGAQGAGMGSDLYQTYEGARALFDQADQILGRPLSKLCFEGPADVLNRTLNAQPAIYVTSLACLEAARAAGGLGEPAFVAGHSLGEYTALAAAGALNFEAGLRLVDTRSKLTQAAADSTPGMMTALLGLDEAEAALICDETGAELCNINAPGQLVIGGRREAVEKAAALALERGARRAIPLDVGGAFHSSLMAPAAEEFRRAVESSGIVEPRVPFIENRSGEATMDPERIADELVYQLTHPVRWVTCVEGMSKAGVTEIVEFGPGRVLTGLIKRIAPEMKLHNVNGAGSLTS